MSGNAELKGNGSGNDLTDLFRRLWPTGVIVGMVVVTVFGGLLLAYQDVPEERPPVIVIRPTPTGTPLPTRTLVPLPTLTPTFLPSLTPTPVPIAKTSTATWTPPATSVPTWTPPPTFTPTPPCLPPASWGLYMVQPGDTLLTLAARHGTSPEAIMQGNCLTSPSIYPGQRLYLPPVYITPTPTWSPTPCKPPVGWQIYVVQQGDTLYSLARRYNTTVYAVVQANCLINYAIYVGQNLYLPPLPATPTPTVTSTSTSTPTATWTSVPTWTPTWTATPIATATPSATVAPTTTDTPTATGTPTTVPPTATDTPLPSATLTASPTATSTTAPPTLTPIPPPPTATPSLTPTS